MDTNGEQTAGGTIRRSVGFIRRAGRGLLGMWKEFAEYWRELGWGSHQDKRRRLIAVYSQRVARRLHER